MIFMDWPERATRSLVLSLFRRKRSERSSRLALKLGRSPLSAIALNASVESLRPTFTAYFGPPTYWWYQNRHIQELIRTMRKRMKKCLMHHACIYDLDCLRLYSCVFFLKLYNKLKISVLTKTHKVYMHFNRY